MSHTTTVSNGRIRIRLDLSKAAPGKKPRRKLKVLEFGNVRIPYGRYKSGKVRYWMLFWYRAGQRIRETRVDFAKLKKRAGDIATDIQNGQVAMAQFTEDQRADYLACLKIASRVTAPLQLLVAEAVEARVTALARTNIVPKTCPQIVDELLKAKRKEGAGVRWIDDLESRLNRFAEFFNCSLVNLSADELNLWLTRLNLGKRSWNNNRTALLALAAFARERKYVPPEWNPLAAIKPFRIAKPVEEIYTPEEMRSMLFTAEKFYPQHLPTLAIMGQAGCRHCELQDAGENLDWKHVYFKTCKIHVNELVAKSNTGRRWIPMQPCLVEWLKPYAKPQDPICVVSNLTNALARIARKAGVKYKQNALRNSFISYRAAATQNIPQVAIEAGNSVSEIEKSYRRELTQEEGLAWFNIFPTRADVLPLFANVRP
ncbi:MAG TPA: hypothetical protein VKV04_16995 [Verrucomicrobiae bacterium]|nr:hypothetical protein [Verrucomicrobiae bacterium]